MRLERNNPQGPSLPDFRRTRRGGLELPRVIIDPLQEVLDEEHVVVTDGAGFGAEGFDRISYATSMEQIQEGIKRIRGFAAKHT